MRYLFHVVFLVRVFKCGHMASNCGRCRTIDVRHGCGWCTGTKRCSIRERCREGSWLGRDQTCPNPAIDQVNINLLDLSDTGRTYLWTCFIYICKMKKWLKVYETFWSRLPCCHSGTGFHSIVLENLPCNLQHELLLSMPLFCRRL